MTDNLRDALSESKFSLGVVATEICRLRDAVEVRILGNIRAVSTTYVKLFINDSPILLSQINFRLKVSITIDRQTGRIHATNSLTWTRSAYWSDVMNSDGNNGSLLLDFVRCGLVQLLESTGRALLGVVPYDLKVDGNLSILWNMKIDVSPKEGALRMLEARIHNDVDIIFNCVEVQEQPKNIGGYSILRRMPIGANEFCVPPVKKLKSTMSPLCITQRFVLATNALRRIAEAAPSLQQTLN
mgnify:CR=1 FL=1